MQLRQKIAGVFKRLCGCYPWRIDNSYFDRTPMSSRARINHQQTNKMTDQTNQSTASAATPCSASLTPETDAFAAQERGLGTGYYQALKHARKLEIERNQWMGRARDRTRVAREILAERDSVVADLREIVAVARHNLPKLHPTIERIADGYPQNVQCDVTASLR